MIRLSDEAWAKTLPLTTGPVVRPESPRLLDPPTFDTSNNKRARCERCDKQFTRVRSTAKFCSDACRLQSYRENK